MFKNYGITQKLILWFLIIVLIFYGTILVLYINVQQVVKISEKIVNKNYTISSSAKKLVENLLNLEENEKKYKLLKKNVYLEYFGAAQKGFEENLVIILALESKGLSITQVWRDIYNSYRNFPAAKDISAYLNGDLKNEIDAETLWIPETVINTWIKKISQAQLDNALEMESLTRELNRKGRLAARNGLIGLGISSLVGFIGILFISYSMVKPLRELLKGIRSISKDSSGKQILVKTKDEFGELADAFNDMTTSLKNEEQMRSDFISMLSHEIRTPLTSIREAVNMISEEVMGQINSRQRKFLEIAGSEIERICELLNHLMQASRLEPGVLKIDLQSVDSFPLISNCILSLKPAAEMKNIKISLKIPPEIPNISADPQHLKQIFLNLLNNAIKFSDAESKISVEAKLNSDSKMIIFFITDNGPGILKEEQAMLFNKYYRAPDMREHQDGVGLGLSITKNIVEAHKGSIWVESELGVGSTFYFTLPINDPGA